MPEEKSLSTKVHDAGDTRLEISACVVVVVRKNNICPVLNEITNRMPCKHCRFLFITSADKVQVCCHMNECNEVQGQ